MSVPFSLAPRARIIREVGTSLFKAVQEPGDWHWNTHHQRYQFALPGNGRFFSPETFLLEMNAAQVGLWLHRLELARLLVDETMRRDPRGQDFWRHG